MRRAVPSKRLAGPAPRRSRRLPGIIPGLVILLIPLGGCATRGAHEDLQSEVWALSARQDSAYAELRRSIDEGRRAMIDSVQALSERMFNLRGAASGNQREIQKELASLSELVGQFQHTVDQLGSRMDVQKQEFEQRIAQLAEQGDSAVEGGEAEVADPAEPVGTPAQAQALFDVAVSNAERDLRTTALRGFQQFLDQYPRDPNAPAAYLHRGELLTLEGRLEEAIDDYLEIPRMFPTSDRIPAALYRAGVLCIELEDYDRAREYLERVINTYPDDRFAEQAREKLDEIP